MNSAMTITQWDVLNSNRESAKPAKLSQEKVRNIDDKYKRFSTKPAAVVTETPVASRISYKDVLNKFRMSALNYGDATVKLSGGRKLKVNPIVRNGALRLFKETITNGDAINVEVVNNPVVNEIKQEMVSNVREFPSRVLATPEYSHNENVSSEPVNNMYSYPTGKPVVETKNEVNEVANNNLSRLSRMDYNNGVMTKEEPKEVKQTPVHTDIYSSTDYVQQKLSGNLKTNSDQDIAQLVEGNKKLDGEISESQSVLQQLEAQLAKLKEINEAQRQARINELEEEKLSKTATLNGLTEQIKALQEAIIQEQRSANEQTSYRRAM